MNALQSLQILLDGNARYQSGECTMSNPPSARAKLVQGQAPIAGVIRCADSRVAPEIVFDQPLGNLFVCGVAGNIPTLDIIESMEFAVHSFGISLIVIMGHSQCGAVTVAMQQNITGGVFAQVSLAPIPDLDECIAHNAEQGVTRILESSLYLEQAVQNGTLQIVAGVQDIESGAFELVAQTSTAPQAAD